jgi:hypothetical protein
VLVGMFLIRMSATFAEQLFVGLRLKRFMADRAFGDAHGGSFCAENKPSGSNLPPAV